MSGRGKRWAWIAAAALLSFHTLLAYGLPPLVPIAGTALLLVLFWLIGPAIAWLVSGTLVLATLGYAGALALLDWEGRTYRAPHERLSIYDVYFRNVDNRNHFQVRLFFEGFLIKLWQQSFLKILCNLFFIFLGYNTFRCFPFTEARNVCASRKVF